MYYHFLGGITTETNFDLILSSLDDECFQIVILFLVQAECISSSLKNRITEHYPDSASNITAGTSYTYLLHTAHCTLLTAHCSLLTAHCSLLTAHCSLLTAHCSLLTAHCSLLTAHCSLLTAHCSLLTAHCSLLTAHCSLLTAHCSLLTAVLTS